jgi:2-dehydro-3-deoxygluconokinase
LTVYCDLNFRKKLWNWRPGTKPKDLAKECMSKILPFVNIMIANEEDAADVLGIHAEQTDVASGRIDHQAYASVAQQIVARFPEVSRVAITLRESLSADHNRWGAMLYSAGGAQVHFAPRDDRGQYSPYEIRDIVDRVGAGDSFAAGLIYALNTPELVRDCQDALSFAVAASCLKHSIQGDFNYVSAEEVLALMRGNASGRVQR